MAGRNESEGLGEPCEGASIIALELAGGKKKQMTPCFSSLRVASLLLYTLNILLKCYPRFPKKQILRQKCMCQHFKRQCDAEEAELSKSQVRKRSGRGQRAWLAPYISPDAQSCGTFKEAV